MMRWADRYFVQQQLREMNLEEPTFAQCPTLLGARPESPEHEQFDSAREDTEEEDGGATSALDAELDASTGEETYTSGFWLRRPQLSSTIKGTVPCAESILGREGNFRGLRIDA